MMQLANLKVAQSNPRLFGLKSAFVGQCLLVPKPTVNSCSGTLNIKSQCGSRRHGVNQSSPVSESIISVSLTYNVSTLSRNKEELYFYKLVFFCLFIWLHNTWKRKTLNSNLVNCTSKLCYIFLVLRGWIKSPFWAAPSCLETQHLKEAFFWARTS